MFHDKAKGEIFGHIHSLPFGTRSTTYSMEGRFPVMVDYLVNREMRIVSQPSRHTFTGAIIEIGQFRLRVIDYDVSSRQMLCVNDNWRGTLRYYAGSTSRLVDGFYRRLILTLYVWGLADLPEWKPPSWRDIKFIKYIKRS